MRRVRQYLPLSFFLLLSLLLYTVGIYWDRQAASHSNVIAMVNEESFYTFRDAEALQKQNNEAEEKMLFAVWGCAGWKQISQKNVNQQTTVQMIAVCGSTRLLFPQTVALDESDRTGCLLDAATASELFGTASVEGQSITYNGNEYEIRGILTDAVSTMVVETVSLENMEMVLNRVSLKTDGSVSVSSMKETFGNRYEMTGEIMDYPLLAGIARLLSLLVPLLLYIFLLYVIRCYRRYAPARERLIWWAVTAAATVFFSVYVFRQVTVPMEYIPTKWSDRLFWATLADEKKKALLLMIRTEKYAPDLVILSSWLRSVAASLSSVFCLVIVWGLRWKNKNYIK